jgi:SAM-dependent methyltransferase
MADPGAKSPLTRLLYRARNLRSRRLFSAIERYGAGTVLDVGGWDFYEAVDGRPVECCAWIVMEPEPSRLLRTSGRVSLVHGDGCRMGVRTASVDTVLNVQVLEHVFEPMAMVEEIARVLKPGGHAIVLAPTTSTMHLAPSYFYNFSRYWLLEAMKRARLEVVEFHALGGIWSSMASHLVYFFLQAGRVGGMSDPEIRRSPAFWLLLPLQALFALLALPFCLLLSLGDLQEEPNNHLVVVRKPVEPE